MDNNFDYGCTPDESFTQVPQVKKKSKLRELLTLPYILLAVCIFLATCVVPLIPALMNVLGPFICDVFGFRYDNYSVFWIVYNSASSWLSFCLNMIVYFVFAFFASKKVSDMFKFIGVSYISITVADRISGTISSAISLITSLIADGDFELQATLNVGTGILGLAVEFICAIVAVVIGLALFMFVNNFRKEIGLKKFGKKKRMSDTSADIYGE